MPATRCPVPASALVFVLVALPGSSGAQEPELHAFRRIPAEPLFGGTYCLATGEWTRGPAATSLAAAGSDIVYNNTLSSGYFAALPMPRVVTAPGRIPTSTSPSIVWDPLAVPPGSRPGSAAGCATNYLVDGFQIGYCSESAGATTSMTLAFYEAWPSLCSAAPAGPVQGGPFALTGLPGSTVAGLAACWVIQIDLAGSSLAFAMKGDGDGVYSQNSDDAFAWSISFPSAISATTEAGPMIAGCPSDGAGPAHPGFGWLQGSPAAMDEAAGYDGTRFDGPAGALPPTWPANGAVGLPNPGGEHGSDPIGDDAFRVDNILPYGGCRFFGGPIGSGLLPGPYANFHLELYVADACTPGPTVIEYCAGDGLDPVVSTPCPCSNSGAVGNGCASSFNPQGAHHTWTGSIVSDTVVLHGTGMNAIGSCIFLKGDTNVPGAMVFGDGIRCADGNLIRLRTAALTVGAAQFPDSTTTLTVSQRGGTPVGSGLTGYYLAYYRNAAATFCPPATFNSTNGTQITW